MDAYRECQVSVRTGILTLSHKHSDTNDLQS